MPGSPSQSRRPGSPGREPAPGAGRGGPARSQPHSTTATIALSSSCPSLSRGSRGRGDLARTAHRRLHSPPPVAGLGGARPLGPVAKRHRMTNQQSGPGEVRPNTLRDQRAPNTFRNQAIAGANGGRDLNAGGGNAGPRRRAARLPLWGCTASWSCWRSWSPCTCCRGRRSREARLSPRGAGSPAAMLSAAACGGLVLPQRRAGGRAAAGR